MTDKKKTGARERTGEMCRDNQVAGETYNEKISPRLAVALIEKEAIAAIEYATAKHPCLSKLGMVTDLFDPYGREFSICAVATAISWMRLFPKSTPQYSSDWLSYKAQEWGGENAFDCAVANGELIVAAVALGFPVKYDGGPNATIGVRLPPTRTMH